MKSNALGINIDSDKVCQSFKQSCFDRAEPTANIKKKNKFRLLPQSEQLSSYL